MQATQVVYGCTKRSKTPMSAEAAAAHDHHHHHAPRQEDYPVDPHYGQATGGKLGMWVFLLSDALTFAGFLLGYAILRGGTKPWIPEGLPELGINFTAILTFLLICSSVTMVLAFQAASEQNRKETLKYLGLTIFGGALFLCGQYKEYFGFDLLGGFVANFHADWGAWLAEGLTDEGLFFGTLGGSEYSAYGSTFYMITAFHGMHVFTGVSYLIVIFIRTYMGKYDDGNTNHIEICGLFWHFVDLVWILVFTFVYLIPE